MGSSWPSPARATATASRTAATATTTACARAPATSCGSVSTARPADDRRPGDAGATPHRPRRDVLRGGRRWATRPGGRACGVPAGGGGLVPLAPGSADAVAPGGQPQERAQVLAPPRLLAERLLALRELPGQTEQRAGGGGLALQVPRRERGRALGQGGRQGALQPALEHPDAAQRALVQRLPGADQVRLLGQRQVPLEGEDHALEGQAIRGVVGL